PQNGASTMKTLCLLSLLALLTSPVFAQDAMTASAEKNGKSETESKSELPILTAKSPIHIWVDQIGFRTNGKKVLVIASNNAIPAELELELRDAKSNQAVWKSKDDSKCVKPFNDGKKDGASGDFIAHLDLSDFKTPGRYFVALLAPGTPG